MTVAAALALRKLDLPSFIPFIIPLYVLCLKICSLFFFIHEGHGKSRAGLRHQRMCFEERSLGSVFQMHDPEEGGPFIAGEITLAERQSLRKRKWECIS